MPILTHLPISKEDQLLQMISKKIIDPGDTVIDIGVNYMQNTRFFLKCVGNMGKVIGIEPNKILLEKIKKYIFPTGPKFEIHPNILAESERLVIFRQYEDPDSGQSGILENMSQIVLSNTNLKYQDIPVTTSRLDKLVTEQDIIGKLALIKIDCEGSDCEILQGSVDLIKKYCPPIIIEIGNHRKKALSSLLSNLEYSLYSLESKQLVNDLSLIDDLNGLLISHYDKKTLRKILK